MELVKGLHRLGREEAIELFLSGLGTLEVVPVDAEVATPAGRIYADLERAGSPIGRGDPLVTAAALAHGCDLITGNLAHFEAVQAVGYPLAIDSWPGVLVTRMKGKEREES